MMPLRTLAPLTLPSRVDPILPLAPALYLSAYDLAGQADGTALASWTGREALHSAWAQGTAGKRPTKQTQGGYPVARFIDTSAQVLSATSYTALQLTSKTVVIVARSSKTFASTVPLLSSGGANWYVSSATSNLQHCSWANTATAQKTVNSTALQWDGALHVYSWRWTVSGANVTVALWRDGTLLTTTTASFTDGYQAVTSTGWFLGAFNATTLFFAGDIGAVVVTSATDDATRQLIERTLGPRWGIPVA
jgi:hypothetical protein